jgi:hypothetical protein
MIFNGHLTFEKVNSLLADLPAHKPLHNILLECLQNIVHHGVHDSRTVVTVTSDEKGYLIQTSNTVVNSDVGKLKEILERVNNLSHEELAGSYKHTLINGSFTAKGTAGLGLIGIARRSGQKMIYDFKKIDEQFSTYFLTITLL